MKADFVFIIIMKTAQIKSLPQNAAMEIISQAPLSDIYHTTVWVEFSKRNSYHLKTFASWLHLQFYFGKTVLKWHWGISWKHSKLSCTEPDLQFTLLVQLFTAALQGFRNRNFFLSYLKMTEINLLYEAYVIWTIGPSFKKMIAL